MPLLEYIFRVCLPIIIFTPIVVWIIYKFVLKYLVAQERSIGNYAAMRQSPSKSAVQDIQTINTSDEIGQYAQKVSRQISHFETAMNQLENMMCQVFDRHSFTYLKYQETVSQIRDPFYYNTNSASEIIMKIRETTWTGNNANADNIQGVTDSLILGLTTIEDILNINQITIQFVEHLKNVIGDIGEPTEKNAQYVIEELSQVTSHVKYYDYG